MYEKYKPTLAQVMRDVKSSVPMHDLATALKYWTYNQSYLGYMPNKDTIIECYTLFINFVLGDSAYYAYETRTALYLESLGFTVDHTCDGWKRILNPLCTHDEEK